MTHFGNLGWRVNIMTLGTIDGPVTARQIPYLIFVDPLYKTQNANPVYEFLWEIKEMCWWALGSDDDKGGGGKNDEGKVFSFCFSEQFAWSEVLLFRLFFQRMIYQKSPGGGFIDPGVGKQSTVFVKQEHVLFIPNIYSATF